MSAMMLMSAAIAAGAVILSAVLPASASEGTPLNLAESGTLLAWEADRDEPGREVAALDELGPDTTAVGLIWDEARDVREVRLGFDGEVPEGVELEYWFLIWPAEPPKMPVLEDEIDDPWRGDWLAARTRRQIADNICTLTFEPLRTDENERADNLPGVNYRRTVKMRVLLPDKAAPPTSLEVHSDSTLEPLSVRIQLGCGLNQSAHWTGQLEVRDGRLVAARPWNLTRGEVFEEPCSWRNVRTGGPAKGIIADLLVSDPAPAGSNDMTVVTVRAEMEIDQRTTPRAFSFNTLDLESGPIYVPDMNAYVTRADDPHPFDAKRYATGRTIRDRIPTEPEQTYERASREIPPQDPWVRQHGEKVYLVMAADASWQKFAVEYDGNVFLTKGGTKAFGDELKRLQWEGDTLRLKLGTGEAPCFREDHNATMAVAEECLPIAINRWESDGLQYEQEAFGTLLDGPLDPNDGDRDEQTPAVLMVRLDAHNPSEELRKAHFWFAVAGSERIELDGKQVLGTGHEEVTYDQPVLRAVVSPPEDAPLKVADIDAKAAGTTTAVACEYDVPAGATKTLFVRIPFVSDVRGDDADRLADLRYDEQRKRVADYWRDVIHRTTQFSTPEDEFNHLARFVVAHIHISATKDPNSGLYMVPAASLWYRVYANEACFQAMLLDALGDTDTAAQYLQTFVELQGSRELPGNYEKPDDGIYHGAKVDDRYDYTAHAYSLDHGTTLWALARHYFYSRDRDWLERVVPSMLKAVDWIERQREQTQHQDVYGRPVPEFGLLPAGHLEDNADWGYWFSVNAYCVAGMIEMARAMADIDHPEAGRIQTAAEAYRRDLHASVMRTIEAAPVVRMRDGTYSPYVPTKARQRFRYFGPLRAQYYSRYGRPDAIHTCYRLSGTRELLYGPMILLDLEILDPDDVMADWILDDWEDNLTLSGEEGFNVHGVTDEALWFSQGGMVWQSNLQNPVLAYLKRHEVPAAIRNLYNNFVACLYPDVNTLTEEYRMWGRASGPFYKSPDEARFVNRLRDLLVLESGDDLWLASGAPRRWLASKEGIRVDRINSYFGPVRYTLHAGERPDTVVARVEPLTRSRPSNLYLYARLPGKKLIGQVEINGKPWREIEPGAERIRLPQTGEPLDILIRY